MGLTRPVPSFLAETATAPPTTGKASGTRSSSTARRRPGFTARTLSSNGQCIVSMSSSLCYSVVCLFQPW